MGIGSTFFYAIVAGIFYYGKTLNDIAFNNLVKELNWPENLTDDELHNTLLGYAGQNRWLTIWCLKLNVFYYCTATIHSLVWPRAKHQDWFWLTIVVPVACITVVMYWSLYFIDPSMLQSAEVRQYFAGALQHIIHTFPIIHIVEAAFIKKHLKFSTCSILFGNLLTFVIYLGWCGWLKTILGTFPYPVLEVLWDAGIQKFAAFIGVCCLVGHVFSRLALWLQR